jgi:acyl dehydratase
VVWDDSQRTFLRLVPLFILWFGIFEISKILLIGKNYEAMKTTGWDRTIHGKPDTGASAERTKRVDERDIELFAQITGDRNPLHFDAEAARRSVFGGLIVQGGVTSGLLNAIVAEDLPGPGTVFLSVEWKFVKAVYVGDSITGRVEITSVRDDKPICTIATTVQNQDGVICLSGTATTYTVALAQSR